MLGCVILAILPSEIVMFQLVGTTLSKSFTPKGVWLFYLQPKELLSTLFRCTYIPNKVVQLANRTLTPPGLKFNFLGSDISNYLFEGLGIPTEEHLLYHKVDDMAYTPHMTLASVNEELCA